MPGKPRQFAVGSIYHIINRGVEQRLIFQDKQDYSRFIIGLECFNDQNLLDLWDFFVQENQASSKPSPDYRKTLAQKLQEYRSRPKNRVAELLAFTLMPNHFHLILQEIIEGGITLFMTKIGGYARYFNRRYHRLGHLFQSRYKMVEIKDDRQLTAVFDYVHTNPVELWEPGWKNLEVKNPKEALRKLKEYRYSSYRDYIGIPTFPNVSQKDLFLDLLGGEQGCRREIENWILYKAGQTDFDSTVLDSKQKQKG